jgi:hypothetical protein
MGTAHASRTECTPEIVNFTYSHQDEAQSSPFLNAGQIMCHNIKQSVGKKPRTQYYSPFRVMVSSSVSILKGRIRTAPECSTGNTENLDLIGHLEKADQTHRIDGKLHGPETKALEGEVGHRAVVRRFHREGFRLKAPRSLPRGQSEE